MDNSTPVAEYSYPLKYKVALYPNRIEVQTLNGLGISKRKNTIPIKTIIHVERTLTGKMKIKTTDGSVHKLDLLFNHTKDLEQKLLELM